MPTNSNIEKLSDFEPVEQTSNTYRLFYQKNKLKGFTDEIDALKQAIYFILNIERYDYLIYNWNYGFEIKDLIGQEPKNILPEIQKRISDALIQDSRINAILNFSFSMLKNKVIVYFTVKSIFGDLQQELNINL